MQPQLCKDVLLPSSVASGYCYFALIFTGSLLANHAEVANELLLINEKRLMSVSHICNEETNTWLQLRIRLLH